MTRRPRCSRFFAVFGSGTGRIDSRGAIPLGSIKQAAPMRVSRFVMDRRWMEGDPTVLLAAVS